MSPYVAPEQTVAMCDLFEGRLDAFGTDVGGCERADAPTVEDFRWRMEKHLEGKRPFGVYPQRDGNVVKWGCIDIDFDDIQLAKNLHEMLGTLQLDAWIEVSRSKGYHVWVFASDWMPAKTMRRALMAACQIINYNPKEVNPKQEELDDKKPFGNYVRLPYPELGLRGRQVMWDPTLKRALSLKEFLGMCVPNKPDLFDFAASLWTPPPPKNVINWQEPTGDVVALIERMEKYNRYALEMFMGGPLEGGDRSTFMMHFLHALKERGQFTTGEALTLLLYLDEMLGKFAGRRDQMERLVDMVESVWS